MAPRSLQSARRLVTLGRIPLVPRSSSKRLGCLGVALLFGSSVLGYGYWHVRTHGSVYLSVYDRSEDGESSAVVVDSVLLLDERGGQLARGSSDPRTGVIYLEHPEIGSCLDAEQSAASSPDGRTAWQRCFETHSRWVLTWARGVRSVAVNAGGCDVTAPAAMRESTDEWWLWWLPHPHLGGKPYTYLNLTLIMDRDTCELRALDD